MWVPYGRQSISEADIAAVTAVLRSPLLTQGPVVPKFEAALADVTGSRHAVAVNSATSALHIACLALDLGPGDWLWTTPNTFVASANAGLYCGAKVDFVDIDPQTFLLDPDKLETKLVQAEARGCLPKIVIPVHFAGQACDMARIAALGQRFGFRLIEDASHAVGATYQGRPVGDGRFSDITVFSFHPVKIITSGEGGAALTNDPALDTRLRLLRSHGVTKDEALLTRPLDGPWAYEQVALGYNYRMTDIHAALGLSQMDRLAAFVARRRDLAQRYDRLLADSPQVNMPYRAPDRDPSWHLYIVRLAPQIDRARVYAHMVGAGIGVQVLYIPVHTQPYYRAMGFQDGDFPEAEAFYASTFTLPIFPDLSDADQDRVVAALETAIRAQAAPHDPARVAP
jgi:UDP-4-amino-4,6-dideoxy-N-acetyl-beta-L-altrosamine transaminase